MLNLQKLDNLYKSYDYTIETCNDSYVRIYCIDTGMYKNIDIVPLKDTVNNLVLTNIKSDLEKSGFSCIIRHYSSIEDAEKKLYHGFFNISKNIDRLRNEYISFKNRIEKVLYGNKYSYINCDYYLDDVSKNAETHNIIDDIITRIENIGAHLMIIEAAAEFGKTCTAFETLIKLIELDTDRIPLIMELSRNRQASIFKYILLSEIDRTFTNSIKLEMVKKQIYNGNIVLIIDGFDELLKSKSDDIDSFEDIEPMLETIKELLQDNAKIILTSRKTSILETDGFYDWLNSDDADFNFSRFELKLPKIVNWIGIEKNKIFIKSKLPPNCISNPVILSYLRNIDYNEFKNILAKPERIVDKYIFSLMEREKERQDLIIDIDEQTKIFENISHYLVSNNISSDESEILLLEFQDRNFETLHNVVKRYAVESNITIEKICRKLINHALFDRKENDYIGFVNDFIFGYFIALSIINKDNYNRDDYIFDEIYSERAIESFKFVEKNKRHILWERLEYLSSFYDINLLLKYDYYLENKIKHDIIGEIVDKNIFENLVFGINCKSTTFIYCEFHHCTFDFANFSDVSFLDCTFDSCQLDGSTGNSVSFIHCSFYASESIKNYNESNSSESSNGNGIDYRKSVLERFWAIGKNIYKPRKPIRTLYTGLNPKYHKAIEKAINSLVRDDLIIINKGSNTAELNIEKISEIKNILER